MARRDNLVSTANPHPNPKSAFRIPQLPDRAAEPFAPAWVACAWIPRFAVWLERQRQPGLPAGPLVLLGPAEAGGKRALELTPAVVVRDCSHEAEAAGIHRGMPAATLARLCPTAVTLPFDMPYYQQRHGALLEALDAVTPEIEAEPLEAFYLDLTGLPHLDPEDPLGMAEGVAEGVRLACASSLLSLPPSRLPVRIGIAPGKFTAWVAAHHATPARPVVITEAERAAVLRETASSLLPVDAEMRRKLDLLGLRTLARIEKLPRSAMLAQFGRQGERAHRLACGEDREPLMASRPRLVIRETLEFGDHPPTVAHFHLALHTLLERLWARPERRGAAVRQVRMEAPQEAGDIWQRTLTLRRPHEGWLTALGELKRRLDGLLPTGAVLALSMELTGLAGRVDGQPVLFTSEKQLRRERLRDALDHLRYRQRLRGQPPVQRIVELDPWSFLPEERHALINYEA